MTEPMTEPQEHIFPNVAIPQTLDTITRVLYSAGDVLESIVIQGSVIKVRTSQPIEFKMGKTLMENVLELPVLQVIEHNGPPIEHLLLAMQALADKAEPRYLILAPGSTVLRDPTVDRFVHKGSMYSSIFGMQVVEEKTLDPHSFVVCGSHGLSWDISTITVAYKGYVA